MNEPNSNTPLADAVFEPVSLLPSLPPLQPAPLADEIFEDRQTRALIRNILVDGLTGGLRMLDGRGGASVTLPIGRIEVMLEEIYRIAREPLLAQLAHIRATEQLQPRD